MTDSPRDPANNEDGPAATVADCVSLLRGMIRFDTVTHHVSGRCDAERVLGEWLAELACGWGLQAAWLPVEGFGANLLVTHSLGAELPWRLFDSHLDTVGVDGMTIDPFGGGVRDGRVWGRGACDTKGTGAAMLWAAKEAIAAGTLGANVAILFSVGEEHDQVGAQAFVNGADALGWRPSEVVVGEPTGMRVVAASNGFLRWRVVTHGHAAHSSTPDRGHNAVSDMARAVVAIEQEHIARIDASHPLTGRMTCSVNGIRGGVQHNIVPDRCEVQLDQRLTPGQVASDALASVRGVLDRLAMQRKGFAYAFEAIESAPPFASEASLELGERLASRLAAAGIESTVAGAPYTTNANHFAPAGLPTVVIGPGDIAQAHTHDEWIAIDELHRGVRGYRTLMEAAP
ncbi:MAG: M20/M25/M40 family metallo-hydrolase [Planctomycetota bacterium]